MRVDFPAPKKPQIIVRGTVPERCEWVTAEGSASMRTLGDNSVSYGLRVCDKVPHGISSSESLIFTRKL